VLHKHGRWDVFSWGVSSFPGFNQVDVCVYAGHNCAGGSNGGLDQGQSVLAANIMSIAVLGNFANGVTFDPVVARFQTRSGAYEFDSALRCQGENCTPVPVPEPASLTLLGSGLALAAARYRRRKQ
jgi:PEP-CTERM motif